VIPTGDQEEALTQIHKWFHQTTNRVFKLGGLAGTGKSSIIPLVHMYLGLEPSEIIYAAPTNKAALVVQNRLSLNDIVANAMTIHKTFYRKEERHCDACPLKESLRNICHGRSGFNVCGCYLDFHARVMINSTIKLIICDESSMVNREVYEDLLYSLPKRVRILFVGDHGQLEAIEDNVEVSKIMGKFELMRYPDFTLVEIQRQAKDSAILKLAYQARKGLDIDYGNYGPGVDKIRLSDELDFDADDPNIVGITYFANADHTNPQHRGRLSVTDLNQIWRANLGIEGTQPNLGERLVCREYIRRLGIPKGTMGIVESIQIKDAESYRVEMFLDDEREYEALISREQLGQNKAIWGRQHLDKWDFGYGLTCHTAQGSEFESVVVFEPPKGFANWLGRQSYSRWLYTAITRAKRNLLLVG